MIACFRNLNDRFIFSLVHIRSFGLHAYLNSFSAGNRSKNKLPLKRLKCYSYVELWRTYRPFCIIYWLPSPKLYSSARKLTSLRAEKAYWGALITPIEIKVHPLSYTAMRFAVFSSSLVHYEIRNRHTACRPSQPRQKTLTFTPQSLALNTQCLHPLCSAWL
jgi:hypothetical protein